ncbi:anaerobic ribonucleoside-triphosphate reductase [Criibacterium bergeronii]|uniref:Anaerobic ribonucleoside-triphosphate reductase n=1 Tax=Criibacterium bergeronii TaxID=1871336 RepID=A0A552VDS0_9FIRM|nr:anaerobic ribonucleoside-triphosphate reductase [Criibacterium bergeronii]TRW28614.1 anaerobic ribonucleoside-triphosphate reductase [Criibacterium bergeronii]
MNIKVIKRNGNEVLFDKMRIVRAIEKAMKYGSGIYSYSTAMDVANEIYDECVDDAVTTISIFTIEDKVFNKLIAHGQNTTAQAYEAYKAVRKFQRENNTTDENIMTLVDRTNEAVITENSNKDAILNSTQRDLLAGEISKDIAMRKIIPAHLVQAHKNGSIHIHDMDYILQPMTNCCLINIGDMFENGTVINKKQIQKPKSFQVACTVLTQIIAQIASNQYGGQSVDLKHLAQFVPISYQKYYNQVIEEVQDEEVASRLAEKLTKKELKSGIQTIQYQVNTLLTTNGQAPFVTMFMNLKEGMPYEKEMAMIVEEVLKQRIEGIENAAGVKITPSFPKLVYVLNESTTKGGKYYYITKLAAQCTAKRMYPDYISEKKMSEIYEGNCFSPMGCRSFLPAYKDEKGEYKFEGRLNIGVQTINLPQVAILAEKDKDKFYSILDERLNLIKEMGLLRYNLLKNQPSDVSPIHWQYGGLARLDQGEKIGKLFLDGYATVSVGYIGLHETVYSMLGESITTKEGHQFAVDILNFMRERANQWKRETRLAFTLYGTPGESTAGRLCEVDQKNFGIIEGVTDRGYYTNSYHVTPSEEIDAFNKLKLEAEFQTISTGGSISYIEIPNMTNNTQVIETVIDFMYNNITYAEFNTKSDYCQVCGYDGEIIINDDLEWECPQCHNKDMQKMNVVRRTCGYLGENFWSKGRTKDIKDRVLHL